MQSTCEYTTSYSNDCAIYVGTDGHQMMENDSIPSVFISTESPIKLINYKDIYSYWCTIDSDSVVQLSAWTMPYIEDFLQPNKNTSRNGRAVIIVSNCQQDRIKVIRSLCLQGLPIDVYGSCIIRECNHFYMNDRWDSKWQQKKQTILFQYDFVLAFENAQYPYYVTEKLYDGLITHTIPFYIGAPNVITDKLAPANSFITNTEEFILTLHNISKQAFYRDEWRNEANIRASYKRNEKTIDDCFHFICSSLHSDFDCN
jgi:hypothetical protein